MADQGNEDDAPVGDQPVNNFSNDGSFLEQFRKMQEQKAKEEEAKREAERAQVTKPLFSRVSKTRPVVMKVGGIKKGLLPGAKLKNPPGVAVKKAFSDEEGVSWFIVLV